MMARLTKKRLLQVICDLDECSRREVRLGGPSHPQDQIDARSDLWEALGYHYNDLHTEKTRRVKKED